MNDISKAMAIYLLTTGSTVWAGTMYPVCTSQNVTVPCDKNGWDFGAQALYIRPTFDGDAIAETYTNAAGSTTSIPYEAERSWAFKLEGSYHFNLSNDFTVNWYHYGKRNQRTLLTGTQAASLTLNTELQPKWDAVNAEFGQRFDYGDCKHMRLHGGGQYARISMNFLERFPADTLIANTRTKFNGFGPRLGADFYYSWPFGLGLYAQAASALLVGDYSFSIYDDGTKNNTTATSNYGSSSIVVPELEGRLGVNYTYQRAQGDLTVDIGYMWVNYFNSQAAITSNFAINGPYIGLKYMGYV